MSTITPLTSAGERKSRAAGIAITLLTVALVLLGALFMNRLGNANARLISAQSQLDQAKAGAAELQTKLDQANNETAGLQKQLKDATAKVSSLQTQADAATVRADGLQVRLDEANTNAARLKTELDATKEGLERARAERRGQHGDCQPADRTGPDQGRAAKAVERNQEPGDGPADPARRHQKAARRAGAEEKTRW
jgi:septal ring factor EnvC (AmiA/AmiB activator)